ncbi:MULTISPECIES: deoxynucleoside kinase [Vibrio]|uniref:dTMP kinase n=1 Tax=Vibrio cortegadensis TaxID=1328770 RepID=A0ABV4M4T3_9VIBR|nr:deoxynucleoside kinase [Vibrio cortegadensis]MDN3696096.1 deoxynucleoside kinase [Vibrio cortegadensis]
MNKFIVFEGSDACGKTTLSQMFAEDTSTVVHTAVVDQAASLRETIDDFESKESAFLFFLLNNFLKSNEVASALDTENVVLDRYLFSTLAYQSILLGKETVKGVFDALNVAKKIVLPDLVVFVKADTETIDGRIDRRGGKLQWYGDEVTQKHSVEVAYQTIFEWFDIPIIEIDTSDKLGLAVEENYQRMKGLIADALEEQVTS